MRKENKQGIAVLIFFIVIIVTICFIACSSNDKKENSINSNIESNSNVDNNIESNSNVDDNIESNSNVDSNIESNSNVDSNSNIVSNSITNISFYSDSYTIKTNSTYALKVKVLPNNTNEKLVWKSSNTSVVTVSDSGIVKGIKEGSASVTVSNQKGDIKATTSVIVKSNAQTTKTFTATFVSKNMFEASFVNASCTTTEDSCMVTTPNIIKSKYATDYTIHGWSTNSNAKSTDIKPVSRVKLTKDTTFYPIASKSVNVTFYNTETKVKNIISCKMYVGDKNCKVKIPTYYKKGSYDNTWHYKENPSKYSALYLGGTQLTVSSDRTYYTQFKHPSYYTAYNRQNYQEVRNFNIKKVITIGQTIFEYENGIPDYVINKHINFLNNAYKRIAWLFIPGKVFVLTSDTYNKYSIAYGLTSYGGDYAFMDVQYDIGYGGISENATIHEMAHAWDAYYGYRTGGNGLSQQNDIVNFYNSLTAEKRQNLTKVEWFAGVTTEYYWHYLGVDPTQPSYGGYKDNYSASEKKTFVNLIEKYINISKRGYR